MKIIKWIVLSLLTVIFVFAGILTYLFLIRVNDYRLQNNHVNDLEDYYKDYEMINESDFIDFDISDDTIKLNDVQMLASHNSYKKTGPAIGRLFVGLGDSFAEARALKYGYQNLTSQFELGIRSMEFDVRLRNGKFEITHVPLVDSSSVAVDFKMALEEIKYYSINNPNHLPMIFLIEIKDDWMMLDPWLDTIDSEALMAFNDLIALEMAEFLITPQDIMKEDMTLRQTITTQGWPSINTLLGKSIFVIHPGQYASMYHELDPVLDTLSVFIGAYQHNDDQPYASFFVENDPSSEHISRLVNQNFIVRTRIDSGLVFFLDRMTLALNSGAQILTSDFVNGRSDLNENQMIYLNNQKMIIKKS